MTKRTQANKSSIQSRRIAKLICERENLEWHAMQTQQQIRHLSQALRVTKNRIRHIKATIVAEQRDRPLLSLVYDRNRGVGRTQ